MSEERVRRYFNSLQQKLPAVSGTARAVVLDSDTGQQLYTNVEVGTQTIRVALDAMAPRIAGGDVLRLEQTGTAANAEYRLAGVSGNRPTSGIIQFMDDVIVNASTGASGVGGRNYGAGDLLIGSASATNPNLWYDYSAGLLALRTGSTNTIALDVTNGIRMYSGSSQRVAIKLDGSGWMAGSSTFAWDTVGNASFAGNLSAGTIDIGGADATSFHVDADGNLWSGAAAYADGVFKVSNAGAIAATSGAIGGWTLGATALTSGTGATTTGIDSAGTNPAFYAGSATPGSAPFRVTQAGALVASSATITGAVNASSGTFSGLVQIGSGTPHLHLDGASALVESSTYVAGTTGWRVTADGKAEFSDVKVRGSIQASVFEYSTLSAFAGGFVVAKSAGKLAAAYAISGTLTTETPAAGGWTFATNDIIRIKAVHTSGVGDTWIVVTRTGTTNEYTTAYQSGTNSVTYPAGTACIDYGVSGQGYFAVAADGTFGASAAWVLRSHAGAPWTTETTHVYAGTDGKLYAGGGNVVLDADGITVNIGTSYAATGAVKFVSTSLASQLRSYFSSSAHNNIQLITEARASTPAAVELYAMSPVSAEAQVLLQATSNAGMSEKTSMIQILAATSTTPSERIFYSSTMHEFQGYLVASQIRPAADSTTALRLQNSTGTAIVTVDTTNSRLGIGVTPTTTLDVTGTSNLNGAVIGNEAGADVDFRIEGDTDANLLFVDASTDRIGIGTNAPATKLHLVTEDAGTNNTVNVLTLTRNTTGTAERYFAEAIDFKLETAGTARTAGKVTAYWSDVNTLLGALALTATDGTADRVGLAVGTDGSAPALGFYGVTPIVRAVLATGAGATVDNVIQALQNLGLVKQS